MKWDELQEGDILILNDTQNMCWHPVIVLPTCRVCNPPEQWRITCICSGPNCSHAISTIDIRKALATGAVDVFRGIVAIHQATVERDPRFPKAICELVLAFRQAE